MCFGKVVFVFNVSLEELLGEHNLNAEDFKKVRFELKKYFDMTKKKKKFETKPQNLLLLNFIQIYDFLFMFFFVFITSLYMVKIHKKEH